MEQNDINGNCQVTDAGARTIVIMLRDKISGEYIGEKLIKRAEYAKAYNDQRITHAINGVPVLEV